MEHCKLFLKKYFLFSNFYKKYNNYNLKVKLSNYHLLFKSVRFDLLINLILNYKSSVILYFFKFSNASAVL